MKHLRFSLLAALLCAASAASAAPKDYQFTGPITALTDTTFAVQKGKENWEFARSADTKAAGELRVGDKVTVHYVMNAVSVETPVSAKQPPHDRPKGAKAAAPALAATPAPAAAAATAAPAPVAH